MWFKKLTGFEETSPEQVRENLYVEGRNIVSKVNNKSYQFGSLEIPSLQQLQKQAPPLEQYNDKLVLTEVIADVQKLHCDPENQNALFQAASQFNLLEMVGPHVTPERGIDMYEHDRTQGPACAIACGAGTIYRNYFVPVKGHIGQSHDNQIDCLYDIGQYLNNEQFGLWKMSNGYALPNREGLLNINGQLGRLSNEGREELKSLLKIGLQWDTEVTLSENRHLVSQAYCSALPVAYSNIDSIYWENFARIILEATYEATLYAALINLEKTACNKVYLTLVGGGAFGNETNWITESLITALRKFKNTPLNVRIVSYGSYNPALRDLRGKV